MKPYEYTFVTFLGLSWKVFVGSNPTLTRNTDASETPPKTSFQRFIEAVVPGQAIGAEIIRAAVENVNAGTSEEAMPHLNRLYRRDARTR
jgi:hypothetical protein